MTTATTLIGHWFYGGFPSDIDPGNFDEVHGQVLADLGNAFLLIRLISWKTHQPALTTRWCLSISSASGSGRSLSQGKPWMTTSLGSMVSIRRMPPGTTMSCR
jgi:hypothetical protein